MLSVIVPVYNISKYLRKCIESITMQSFADMEIILIDDGSTDDSGSICDEMAEKDDRVKVFHQDNMGLVNARKLGIRKSSGEFITFVDGDDWIEDDSLSFLMDQMLLRNPDVVISKHYVNKSTGQTEAGMGVPAGFYSGEELINKVFPVMIAGKELFDWGIYASFWAKLFRRDLLEPLLLAEDERLVMGEDAAVVYPYLALSDSILVCDKCTYHYRQTLTSMVKVSVEPEVERMRFRALFNSGENFFFKHKERYDFLENWRKYVLFLMIPRMDVVYYGYDNLNELFPFSGVKKGMKVVLYGAGTYGQRLMNCLNRNHLCRVVHWVDRDFMLYRELGLNVEPPDCLYRDNEYDAIVIANSYYKSRMGLYDSLICRFPKEKVFMIDVERILSYESMKRCGLVD